MSEFKPSDPLAASSTTRRPGIHRRMYDWVLHWAATPYGAPALFGLSFAESSFFPIPPDVLLIALVIGAPKKWFRFAANCSVASVLGGMAGYAIGMFLWAGVGPFFHDRVPGFGRDVVTLVDDTEVTGLLERERVSVSPPFMKAVPEFPLSLVKPDGTAMALTDDDVAQDGAHIRPFTKAGALYAHYDWWIVSAAGFTPLPYKVFTITAGVFHIDFVTFCLASAVSRSLRFFLVAGLMAWFGPTFKPLIDRYFNLLCVVFLLLLIGGFAIIRVF